APDAVENGRVQLAEDSGGRGCGLARVQQVVLGALEGGLRFQRRVERVDDALRAAPAAVDDRRDVGLLGWKPTVREVDAGDLEQAHARGAARGGGGARP